MTKPIVLNNGIFLRQSEYNHTFHLDAHELMAMNKGRENVTDLGMVMPFVNTGYLVNPSLFTFSNLGRNRVTIDGHLFKHSHPTSEIPFYIVEDLSNSDQVGRGGDKFRLKMRTRKYDNGYIMAFDYHEPTHIMITEDPIIQDGEFFIYTFKMKGTNLADRWVDKNYLKPGTILYPITTIETEYSQMYSSLPELTGGMREYINYIGYTGAQISYSVTRDAARSKISNNCTISLDQAREVLEMYTFRNGSYGADLHLQGQDVNMAYFKKYGSNYKEEMQKDIVEYAWIPRAEAMAMSLIEMMVEQEAIFGSGGTVSWDGKGEYQTALGLYHQLNMGNQHVYNLWDWTIEKFEYVVASRLKDKIEPFNNNNVVKFTTGRGGLAWAKAQLRKLPSQNGLVWNAEPFVQGVNGNGPNQSLHFAAPDFVSWDMANGYGKVMFELNPALDPVDANPMINPIVPLGNSIGGHRLSSYMFISSDITDYESDNILELVYGPDWDFNKSVEVGKLPYTGQPKYNGAHIRSSNHPGFKVMMEKKHKAYFVKDVTKSLIIKPLNPTTGKPLFSGRVFGE